MNINLLFFKFVHSGDDDGPSNEDENTGKSKSKDKSKDKQSKIGKRRGSRPFRRAMTLFEGKKHHHLE